MEEAATRFKPIQPTARSALKRIRQDSLRFNIVSLNRDIDACEALFGEDQIIDVAILGQFKAGKSSFLNSLIGQNVLPVGILPVTTVITRLRYGRTPKGIVTQFDGSTFGIAVEDVGEFVSEEKNPANEKNVEIVDIELPSLERYQGLRLVDTPGLGSVFKYNTDTSEDWLPRVGAAIVAVSADRPLSDNDLGLLRDLARYTPKVVLLLTKADLLSHEQQEEVIRFLNNTLRREIHPDLPVCTYSTRVGADLLKSRIETFLLGLTKNRGFEFDSILRHKVVFLVNNFLSYLEVAFKASQKADEDRENLKHLILTEKLNYDLIRSELFVIARENMLQTRAAISARLELRRLDLTRKFIDKLRGEMPDWRGNLWRLTRRYEEWLEENLATEFGDVSRKEHRHFFGTLTRTHLSVSRSLDLFRNLLDRNIEAVLGVKLSPAEWDISVPEPPHPDIAFAKVFDFHFDLLWFLIPMPVFRRLFERHFLKLVPSVVQMHLSRLAYQWEVRINKEIEEVRDQALKYVQDELSTIDALVSRVAGQSDAIRSAINELQGALRELGEASIDSR